MARAVSTGSATRVGGGSAGVNGVSDGQKVARLQHGALGEGDVVPRAKVQRNPTTYAVHLPLVIHSRR